MLKPAGKENAEIGETSWTKIEKSNENTVNTLEDLCWHSQNNNELLAILPQSSFQPEQSNHNRFRFIHLI